MADPKDSSSPKARVAARAMGFVEPGMRLGLGTGSTATIFVDRLGAEVAAGLDIVCVPTSERTRIQAERLGIPLATLDEIPELDLTVDGADAFDPALRLVKGGGGALLREKIVASASRRMVVIADSDKRVAQLGRFPLPVEVVPFGLGSTRLKIGRAAEETGASGELRLRSGPDGQPFVTDGGHFIIDCHFGVIPDPDRLALALAGIPGVVEHGLFIGLASAIVTDDAEGTLVIDRQGPSPEDRP